MANCIVCGTSHSKNMFLVLLRVKTKDGKFRYFIRYCLVHRSLHALVEFLKSKRRALQQWYYEDQSSGKQAMTTMAQFGGGSTILLHEELSEQFR